MHWNPETNEDTLLFYPTSFKTSIKNIVDGTVIETDTVWLNNTTNSETQKIIDLSLVILRKNLETSSCSFWLLPPNRPQCYPVYIQEYNNTVVFRGRTNGDQFLLMSQIRLGRTFGV